jgi:hypothetical protein
MFQEFGRDAKDGEKFSFGKMNKYRLTLFRGPILPGGEEVMHIGAGLVVDAWPPAAPGT